MLPWTAFLLLLFILFIKMLCYFMVLLLVNYKNPCLHGVNMTLLDGCLLVLPGWLMKDRPYIPFYEYFANNS